MRLNKILWLLLAAVILLAVGSYYFLAMKATDAVKAELDARIAQIHSALLIKYTNVWVNPITRVATVQGVSLLPAGPIQQLPVTIKQIQLSIKQDAAGEITQLVTQMQDLNVPIGPQMQAVSPLILTLAKQLNTTNLVGNLDFRYDYNTNKQQVALAFTYQLHQLGLLNFDLTLGHFTPGQQSLLQLIAITLVKGHLNYQDESLMPRLFGLLAQQAGMSVNQYQQQWVQKLQAQAASSQSALRKQILAQLVIFCLNPKALSISAAPPAPISLSQLHPAEQDAFVDALNIKAIANPVLVNK